MSILTLVSKVFEKIIYNYLYEYIENFLNRVLCRFRKAYSTKHLLFRLLQKWQKIFVSTFTGTILMDFSKPYDCFRYDSLTAKLETCDIGSGSLNLLLDYLTFRKQRTGVWVIQLPALILDPQPPAPKKF